MTWAQASLEVSKTLQLPLMRVTHATSYFSRSSWVRVVTTTEFTPCMHACVYIRRYKIWIILRFYLSLDLPTLTRSDDHTSTLHSDDWNAWFVDDSRTAQLPSIEWQKPLLHTFQVSVVVVITTKWTLCVHAYTPAGTPPWFLQLCTTYNAHKLRRPDIYFALNWHLRIDTLHACMCSHPKVQIKNILWFYCSVDLTTLTSSDNLTSTLHSDDRNARAIHASRTPRFPSIE